MDASAVSLFQAFFPDLDAELAEFILRQASVHATNISELAVDPTAAIEVEPGVYMTAAQLRAYFGPAASSLNLSDAELLLRLPELFASKQAAEQDVVTQAEAELFLDLTHMS